MLCLRRRQLRFSSPFWFFFLPFFFFRFLFFFFGGAFVDPDAFPLTGAAETEFSFLLLFFWGAFSASSSVIDSAAECCAAAMNDVDREVYARITGLGVQKSARIQSCDSGHLFFRPGKRRALCRTELLRMPPFRCTWFYPPWKHLSKDRQSARIALLSITTTTHSIVEKLCCKSVGILLFNLFFAQLVLFFIG